MSIEAENPSAVTPPVGDVQQQPSPVVDPVQPPAEPEKPAKPGRVRGENGRFIKEDRESRQADFVAKQREIVSAADKTRDLVADQIADRQLDGNNADEVKPPAAGVTPPVDPVAKSGEGPSEDLLAVAEALGVPDYVRSMAKSDDALQIAIALHNPVLADNGGDASRQPQQQQQPPQPPQAQFDPESLVPEELRVKMLLPEEYVDPEDPMYQQQKHLVDTVSQLQELVAFMAGEVINSKKDRDQQTKASVQRQFDETLDKLEWEMTGTTATLPADVNHPNVKVRMALYPAYLKLQAALPGMQPERVAELAYEQVFKRKPAAKKSPNEVARLAALQRSNQRILGSGNGGLAPPEPKLSKKDQFLRRVAEIQAQRR